MAFGQPDYWQELTVTELGAVLTELDEAEKWERYEAWQHTASISSLIANIYRNPEKCKEPFTWADFNPVMVLGLSGKLEKPQKPKQSWQDQKRNIEMFNAALGGTDRRKGR